GVVNRAIEYRCSHEDEQRPLLVYPLPCSIDSADCERRLQWRRGDPCKGVGGYQPALEKLLRHSYGTSNISLDSYLDEVQLQQTNAMASGEHLSVCPQREGDRFSLTRTFETLLDWVAEGYFPWQSRAEVALLASIAAARGLSADGVSTAVSVPLAADLKRLGDLYRKQGRERQAQQCFEESTELRQRLLGDDHADTRLSRACLAGLLRQTGKLHESKFLYELLMDDCQRLLGADHPETLAVRAGLAATLAELKDFMPALALHEEVTGAWDRLMGPDHAMTLASRAGWADTLTRAGDLSRARMFYETVLEGRERLLGSEHRDTLRCTQQLAVVLCELGDTANARKLQEGAVRARERHNGSDHADTVRAREALAEIVAAQGDLKAVRAIQEALAKSRDRSLGSEHPATLSSQLQLATTLCKVGDLESARRIQQHVVNLQEKIHGMDDIETLKTKKLLAVTLSNQGHKTAARELEEIVREGSNRLNARGMPSGPHETELSLGGDKPAILEPRGGSADPETLYQKLEQLQQFIDNRSVAEARELADSLRPQLLRSSFSTPLRRRAVDMIKLVYTAEGDKDALLAFAEARLAAMEGDL
ncbi:MAG: tetratricopeptide repeat protein, partial [Telluria sp.]